MNKIIGCIQHDCERCKAGDVERERLKRKNQRARKLLDECRAYLLITTSLAYLFTDRAKDPSIPINSLIRRINAALTKEKE